MTFQRRQTHRNKRSMELLNKKLEIEIDEMQTSVWRKPSTWNNSALSIVAVLGLIAQTIFTSQERQGSTAIAQDLVEQLADERQAIAESQNAFLQTQNALNAQIGITADLTSQLQTVLRDIQEPIATLNIAETSSGETSDTVTETVRQATQTLQTIRNAPYLQCDRSGICVEAAVP